MSDPLVSVHMITYNHAPYISRAIEGVLKQKTSFPFDLVIGEDCSTDGTLEIVLDYCKKYPKLVRVVTSEQNVGMKKNNWRTLRKCLGKYIAWCEGDDYWHRDDKLQIQIDFLEKNPEYGLVSSDYDRVDLKEKEKIRSFRRYSGKNKQEFSIYDIISGEDYLITCTVEARKELVLRVIEADEYLHLDEHFKMGDTQLWAEISLLSKIHCLDDSLATYQILEESATQSNNLLKKLEFWISNSEMCMYICNKHGLPNMIRRQHEKNWINKSLKLAYYGNRLELANCVKKKYPLLSLNNYIWYLGAKYSLAGLLVNFFVNQIKPILKKI